MQFRSARNLLMAALLAGAAFGVTVPVTATLFTWSQTAGSNNTADSTINLSEGQAPSTLNNAARAMMAAVAKYRDDLSGKLNTAGSSTAYTLTSSQIFTSLSDGIQIAFRLDETNGAAPTLNVDGLGAKALRLVSATNLTGSELIAGAIYWATYDAGGDEWLVNNPVSQAQVPAGTLAGYGGSTIPSGWLECDGTTGKDSVADTSLASLFTAIGTTYGGTGAADFDLPDCTGRVLAGQESSATRLTSAEGGVDGATLGATGGVEAHANTEAETRAHTHTGPSHTHSFSATSGTNSVNHSHGININSGNNSVPHSHTYERPDNQGESVRNDLAQIGVNSGITAGTATSTQSANHNHNVNGTSQTQSADHTHSVSGTSGASGTANTGSTGSSATHRNVQPTIVVKWMIKK